jgi:exodeoxyribonuclease-3
VAVGEELRNANIYVPNGNSGGEAGFARKLAWLEQLRRRAAALLADDVPLAFAGDFNICPTDEDFAPGTLAPDDALIRPPVRAAFRALLWLGLTDAVRALHPQGPVYTFWDYQGGAWPRYAGLRIDHALLSPTLAERLAAAEPQRRERGEEQPSDHVPLLVQLD